METKYIIVISIITILLLTFISKIIYRINYTRLRKIYVYLIHKLCCLNTTTDHITAFISKTELDDNTEDGANMYPVKIVLIGFKNSIDVIEKKNSLINRLYITDLHSFNKFLLKDEINPVNFTEDQLIADGFISLKYIKEDKSMEIFIGKTRLSEVNYKDRKFALKCLRSTLNSFYRIISMKKNFVDLMLIEYFKFVSIVGTIKEIDNKWKHLKQS